MMETQNTRNDTCLFAAVYNQYHHVIYEYTYLLTQCSMHAQDIVQDVFIKLWMDRERIGELEHTRAYLYTLARNRVIDQFRRSQKEQCILKELGRQQHTDRYITDGVVAERELRHHMAKAVAQLPPQRKLVYSLGKIHGWKRNQIARVMGISPATVRAHMNEALRFVKNHFRQEEL